MENTIGYSLIAARIAMNGTNELTVRLCDGTRIVLSASLSTITTYVLLEQEAWFEKEADFVPRLLKPGMTVLDIGANVGVYSLPLARRVGPAGKVYAYEPASEPRRLLEKSREANGARNLHIVAAALSDRPRQAHLVPCASSELHSLSDSGAGESVDVTSLDEEDDVRNWGSPDFVKIDAEGEERRILEGGRSFFTRHSPLVMFEVKAGDVVDKAIPDAFRALGYRIFRLLPGAPILVPVEPAEALDTYELNLFAAKPERAATLAREGWLVETVPAWSPDERARTNALQSLAALPFGPAMFGLRAPSAGSPYLDALAGYSVWRTQGTPLPVRYAALRYSRSVMRDLCAGEPRLARLSSYARIAWDLGERQAAVAALKKALAIAKEGAELTEPFWPCNPRFDAIAPGREVGMWFVIATLEQLERASSHSSCFVEERLNLDWLVRQPFISTEMVRRHVLKQLRTGGRLAVPERLCKPAEDHINFDLWRSGAVPNTLAP